jgi:hypothetical protein
MRVHLKQKKIQKPFNFMYLKKKSNNHWFWYVYFGVRNDENLESFHNFILSNFAFIQQCSQVKISLKVTNTFLNTIQKEIKQEIL